MGFLDSINPFKKIAENLTGTLDIWVTEKTVDRDKAIEFQTQINLAQIEVEKMAQELERLKAEITYKEFELKEKSYQIALQTTTTPKVDAFHKLSRTLQSFTSMILSTATVLILALNDVPITAEMASILGSANIIGGIYAYKKGKGVEPR